MPPTPPDPDAPRCPACNYDLTFLSSPRCPECGQPLPPDLTPLRPSQRSSPWSPTSPTPLLKGIPTVLRHPIRTLSLADDPARLSTPRALLFASLCLLPLIPLWNPIRNIGCATSFIFSRDHGASPFGLFRDELPSDLSSFSEWSQLAGWEAFSLAHWLLLFLLLSFLPRLSPQSSLRTRLLSLLLFAPWIVILELLHLVGVWLADPSVVPEPSSLWTADYSWLAILTDPQTLCRTLLSIPLVATLFFRSSLRWPLTLALPAALLLSPLAALWSCLSSTLYGRLFLN